MHHKKKQPKNRRAGCKLCKPWKMNRAKRSEFSFRDRSINKKADDDLKEVNSTDN